MCAELRRASAMHSVTFAPGVDAVTSPRETALFGFLRPNQTSQSITVLHTDPLSQQNPIRRITRAPNLFNFAGESRTQTGEKIAEIIRWKGSILNMEKYLGVQ